MIKILDYLFIFCYYYIFKQCQDHEILVGTYDVSGRYYLGIITITIIITYKKKSNNNNNSVLTPIWDELKAVFL